MTFERWWQQFTEMYPEITADLRRNGCLDEAKCAALYLFVGGKQEGLTEMRDVVLQTIGH